MSIELKQVGPVKQLQLDPSVAVSDLLQIGLLRAAALRFGALVAEKRYDVLRANLAERSRRQCGQISPSTRHACRLDKRSKGFPEAAAEAERARLGQCALPFLRQDDRGG